MGIEIFFVHLALTFLFCLAVILYGLFVTVRQWVRFTRNKVLHGIGAGASGIVLIALGCALMRSFWSTLYVYH